MLRLNVLAAFLKYMSYEFPLMNDVVASNKTFSLNSAEAACFSLSCFHSRHMVVTLPVFPKFTAVVKGPLNGC